MLRDIVIVVTVWTLAWIIVGVLYIIFKYAGRILNNTFFWLFTSFIGVRVFHSIDVLLYTFSTLYLLCLFFIIFHKHTIINTKKKPIPEQLWDANEYTERLCQEYGFDNPTIAKYEQEYQKLVDEVEQEYIQSLRKDDPSSWNEHIAYLNTQYRLTTPFIVDAAIRIRETHEGH